MTENEIAIQNQFNKAFIDCSSYTDTLRAIAEHANKSFEYYEKANEDERRDDAQLAFVRLVAQVKLAVKRAEELENIIFDSK